MLVVYTAQARAAAGGTAGMQATIELAVLEANQAYAKSGVPQHLRLVHTAELAYGETGDFNAELSRLCSKVDGHMDEVHALREQYGADLVSLIVASSSYCGMAYRMPVADSWFADYAFSVVARDCATGYYSFAHELGHNMGCAHDHANASASMFPWGYGHRGSGWRTIMSYAPGVRVDHFSNPTVSYGGEPTGVAGSGATAADNADVLARNAGVIAGFRGAPVERFGTGKTTSLGDVAAAVPVGDPSVSGGAFRLRLRGGVPLRSGIVHYGATAAEQPFLGGTLYVAPPLHRLQTFVVGHDGKVLVDLPADASLVGQTVYYQLLFRDPAHADGSGAGMTNGVRVTWLP